MRKLHFFFPLRYRQRRAMSAGKTDSRSVLSRLLRGYKPAQPPMASSYQRAHAPLLPVACPGSPSSEGKRDEMRGLTGDQSPKEDFVGADLPLLSPPPSPFPPSSAPGATGRVPLTLFHEQKRRGTLVVEDTRR
jgi:hypothetical protein